MKQEWPLHMFALSRPEYLPVVWQAKAGTLQQELQDLKPVTEQEGLVMQDEVSSLKGQLDAALADYTAQMASAAADSAKENNKLREQLDLALAESKSLRQQEERAFTAGHATVVRMTLSLMTAFLDCITLVRCRTLAESCQTPFCSWHSFSCPVWSSLMILSPPHSLVPLSSALHCLVSSLFCFPFPTPVHTFTHNLAHKLYGSVMITEFALNPQAWWSSGTACCSPPAALLGGKALCELH